MTTTRLSIRLPVLIQVTLLVLLLSSTFCCHAFTYQQQLGRRCRNRHYSTNGRSSSRLEVMVRSSSSNNKDSQSSSSNKPNTSTTKKQQQRPQRPRQLTIAELQQELLKNPTKYLPDTSTPKKKYRRTRKRVEHPQQSYIYKNQRQRQVAAAGQQQPVTTTTTTRTDPAESSTSMEQPDTTRRNVTTAESSLSSSSSSLIQQQVRDEFGLFVTSQHVDPAGVPPRILGKIRVVAGTQQDDNNDSDKTDSKDDTTRATTATTRASLYAYVLEKPMGWGILGGGTSSNSATTTIKKTSSKQQRATKPTTKMTKQRVLLQDHDEEGSVDSIMDDYDLQDVLAVMTPAERQELFGQSQEEEHKDEAESLFKDEAEEEHDTMDQEHGSLAGLFDPSIDSSNSKTDDVDWNVVDERTAANLRRILARSQERSNHHQAATFAAKPRPSLVAWLKEQMAAQGTPIRGGKFWTALAGAVDVDDSGLVLLCPRAHVADVFVDYTEYVAVMGTGGFLAPPRRSKTKSDTAAFAKETVQMELLPKLRKGRDNDVVQPIKVIVPDTPSTCSSLVELCQSRAQQGVRGDPAANPFDRRAHRRLIHCSAMSASSLLFDETVEAETTSLPGDISILTHRRVKYESGSFVGRALLRDDPMTTAYREINGAADGFPGWIVDRYDKWLLIQHDPKMPKGPIPSIHDGNTAGVYYVEMSHDRIAEPRVRPRLLEGQAAPERLTVLENGVRYCVSLDQDLFTGIFLDQRPQRAWLTQNCCESTHVLHCFARAGPMSVAAATAGASTVSLDTSQKWLERLPEHLEANGISLNERHDCIYGDCFDWLARLGKRGEKFDIVILDPPSTGVAGRKKKRWSVKNDMDELVSLAAPLVKSGGLLWTSTNSAGIDAIKFARLCRKGLENAGIEAARLERIQPMPFDFPSIGAQPVKNLVWRLP